VDRGPAPRIYANRVTTTAAALQLAAAAVLLHKGVEGGEQLGHGLLDHLIRPLQERLGDRQAEGLAVFRLMTSSNLMGRSTGKSAGFAPLRILST
jgi:hypothetical protein